MIHFGAYPKISSSRTSKTSGSSSTAKILLLFRMDSAIRIPPFILRPSIPPSFQYSSIPFFHQENLHLLTDDFTLPPSHRPLLFQPVPFLPPQTRLFFPIRFKFAVK